MDSISGDAVTGRLISGSPEESSGASAARGSPNLGFSCAALASYFDSQIVPKAEQLNLMDGLPFVEFVERLIAKHDAFPDEEKFAYLHSILFGFNRDADFLAQVKARFTLDAMCVGVLRPEPGDAPLINRDAVLKLEGFLDALIESKAFNDTVASRNARAAASERHRENRDMKRLVFTWLGANRAKFKSMDAAAAAIAGRVVPISVRTARGRVSDWHKEQA